MLVSDHTVMPDDVRDVLLSTLEESLDAQLRAVRRLRRKPAPRQKPSSSVGLSHVDMAFDILTEAVTPLHVSVLIERIHRRFRRRLDRESLVSALSKKVARGDRFRRTDKNTFALRAQP